MCYHHNPFYKFSGFFILPGIKKKAVSKRDCLFFNLTLPLSSSILIRMAATGSKSWPAQKLLPVRSRLQTFRMQLSDYCLHCYSWQIVFCFQLKIGQCETKKMPQSANWRKNRVNELNKQVFILLQYSLFFQWLV